MGRKFGEPSGHLRVRSYLAVPVRSRSGDVIGGLFFGHSTPRAFTDCSERLVLGIAAQAGIAIDNARLYVAAQASDERELLLESERAARTAAERLSEVKDEFLATLSHELRTPLNAISGGRKCCAPPRTKQIFDKASKPSNGMPAPRHS